MTNNALLREINEIRCLRALLTHRAVSRSEIGRSLGLSRATVGNAIRGLLQSSLVIEAEEPILHSTARRPGIKV